jgi:hypothetical protein
MWHPSKNPFKSRMFGSSMSLLGLFLGMCTTSRASEKIFYENLKAASDACSPGRVESEVGHQTFAQIRTMAFAKSLGGDLPQAKEVLTKVADVIRTKSPDKLQLADYISCVSEKLTATSANPFEISRFFGVEFKSDRSSTTKLGVALTSERTNETFGPFVMVDRIRGEPSNTLERELFYKEGYGLYRAILRLGAAGGNELSPDEAYLRWSDMAVKLSLAKAKTLKTQPFETFDKYKIDDIRSCPKGNAELKNILATAPPDDLRKFLVGGKDQTTKESQFFAIFCEMMPEPRFEFSFDGWDGAQEIILAVIVNSPKAATVNLVLVDRNIAEFVVNERKQK